MDLKELIAPATNLATLNSAASSGAVQDVDFDATDIKVCTIPADGATLNFSTTKQVAECTLILQMTEPNKLGATIVENVQRITEVDYSGPVPLDGITIADTFLVADSGQRLYWLDASQNVAREYALATPYDVSSVINTVVSQSPALHATASSTYGFAISPDGTKVYVGDKVIDQLKEYTLSTPWDLSTATDTTHRLDIQDTIDLPCSIYFKSDGTKAILMGNSWDFVSEFTFTTPWDLSTGSLTNRMPYIGDLFGYSFILSEDGTRLISYTADDSYLMHPTECAVFEMATPWDLSSAVLVETANVRGTNSLFPMRVISGPSVFCVGNWGDMAYTADFIAAPPITFSDGVVLPVGKPIRVANGYRAAAKFVTVDGGASYQMVALEGGLA